MVLVCEEVFGTDRWDDGTGLAVYGKGKAMDVLTCGIPCNTACCLGVIAPGRHAAF